MSKSTTSEVVSLFSSTFGIMKDSQTCHQSTDISAALVSSILLAFVLRNYGIGKFGHSYCLLFRSDQHSISSSYN